MKVSGRILLGFLLAWQVSASANSRIRGLALLSDLNCGNCHDLSSPRGAPNLREGLLPAKYLRDFIADPQRTKPGTVMPHALSHLAESERLMVANELTHFLYSIAKHRPIE